MCRQLLLFHANNTAELYDPATGIWRLTGRLSRRVLHSATLLPSGQVLVVGGWDWGFDIGSLRYLNTAELYDPVTEVWRPTRSPVAIAGENKALMLPDGRVLVVSMSAAVAELFDPSTESWSMTTIPSLNRGPLTLLPSGLVLMAAGNLSEVYDPATEVWSSAGNLNAIARVQTLTVLRNGLVLAVGSRSDWRETRAELFDPATRTWQPTGSNLSPRSGAYTATLLPNGRVLVAGGYDPVSGQTSRSIDLYDPAAGVWNSMPELIVRRAFHTATLLPSDKVLFVAGIDGDFDIGTVFHASTEIFDLGLPHPTFLTVNPGTIAQGQCYAITVGNGSGMTVDVQYQYEAGPVQTLIRWPELDQNGRAEICATQQTPLGTYEFTAVRNTDTGQWLPVSSLLTVTPGLPRPTFLRVNPGTVAQGQCYSITVGNGSGMTVDVPYRYEAGPVQTLIRWPKLDQNGRAENICTTQQTPLGTYEFTAVRNTDTDQWLPVSSGLTVTPP